MLGLSCLIFLGVYKLTWVIWPVSFFGAVSHDICFKGFLKSANLGGKSLDVCLVFSPLMCLCFAMVFPVCAFFVL
jgi:hypothetical protein